ncbi:MAG TPA: DUF1003 domain-containing protein [Rhizobacter sp.]|nr:DUF1003 domain-containing protein [Rhizobacter sp.]
MSSNRHSESRNTYRRAGSVSELTEKNIRAIVELENKARSNESRMQRVAHAVASFCGTLPFLWAHVLWFAGWITFNTLGPQPHIDPYPFTFLTLLVSLEAIFLSTFILISQNEETRLTERRNALDLQINLLTEQENTKMLRMLGKIADKLGIPDDDPSSAVLEQATRPDKLAAQIDRISGEAK